MVLPLLKSHPSHTGSDHVELDLPDGRTYLAQATRDLGRWPPSQVSVKLSTDGGTTWTPLTMRLLGLSKLIGWCCTQWPPERTRRLFLQGGVLCLEYDDEWIPFEGPFAGGRESRWIARYSERWQGWRLKRVAYLDYE